MKNIILRLEGVFVPIILCIALFTTAFLSNFSTNNLQGHARVINYVGYIRGATQQLIKKEFHNTTDDKLIEQLDQILSGLVNGSKELDLVKLESIEFQSLLLQMQYDWTEIKTQIYNYRNGMSGDQLYSLSENYFTLADTAVSAAETYSDKNLHNARILLLIVNLIFLAVTICYIIFAAYQKKCRNKLIKIDNENRIKNEQLYKHLQALITTINELSELVYVTDLHTHNLLFVNETGIKTFNIPKLESQMKCYKVLRGLNSPCEFCTNNILKADETYSCEQFNPLTQKYYLVKDRLIEWDGHMAKLEIAFDITKSANEKIQLQNRLDRDNILLDCIRELYHNNDLLSAITNVLEQTAKLFFAERGYVFLLHEDKFSNICEWCMEGVAPQINILQNLPQDNYPGFINMLNTQESVIISDVKNLKSTMPTEYELLRRQTIDSLILIPLQKKGEIIGFIGLDNLTINSSQNAVPYLQTLQYFITLSMQRDEDEKNLYSLSYLDKLTLLFNRNRYIQDINSLKIKQESVGVVYLDMNGLKLINDTLGHDAGDRLLKKCADIIRDSFQIGNHYRVGGDEFIVICTNISKETFLINVDKLKTNFMNSDCKIAIGFDWNKSCENIENIIKTADELMYADKKQFYQNNHSSSRYRYNNDLL